MLLIVWWNHKNPKKHGLILQIQIEHIFFYKTGELFPILYGIERPGDDWKCGHASAQKAAAAGVGAHRLERPPIADQMHVVVWVIKANDIRFEQGKYREIINFVLHQLKRECRGNVYPQNAVIKRYDRVLKAKETFQNQLQKLFAYFY